MFIEEWKIVIYKTCFLFLGRDLGPCALNSSQTSFFFFFSFIFLQVIIQEIACSLYKDSWRMKYEHNILKKKESMNTKFFLSNFCPIFVIVIWCDNYRILTFRIIFMMIALYHQVKTPVSFFLI